MTSIILGKAAQQAVKDDAKAVDVRSRPAGVVRVTVASALDAGAAFLRAASPS